MKLRQITFLFLLSISMTAVASDVVWFDGTKPVCYQVVGKTDPVVKIALQMFCDDMEKKLSEDGKWVRHLDYDQRTMLKEKAPDCGVEPDFYFMTRDKFSHLHIVIGYLVFFLILVFHLRHAFPSVFQTLGLNNYKYNPIIEALGKIYTWIVVLGFAAVPILVYLGV